MWRIILRIISAVCFVAGIIGWITIPDDAALWPERFGPLLASMSKDDIIILLFAIILALLFSTYVGPFAQRMLRSMAGFITRWASAWATEDQPALYVAEETQRRSMASTMSTPAKLFHVDHKPSSTRAKIRVSGVVATGRAKAGYNKFYVIRDDIRRGAEVGYYEFTVFVPDERSMIARSFEFEDDPNTRKNVRYSLSFHPADGPKCVGYVNSSGDSAEKGFTRLQVSETRRL